MADALLDTSPSNSRRTADADPASWRMRFSGSHSIEGTILLSHDGSSFQQSTFPSWATGVPGACHLVSHFAVFS